MPRRPGAATAAADLQPEPADDIEPSTADAVAAIYAQPGELHKLVGDEVRAVMGRRRMSAKRLGFVTGVSRGFFGRRLRDETPFDLNDLEVMSLVLDVPVEDLLLPALRELDRRRAASLADAAAPAAKGINRHCSPLAGQRLSVHGHTVRARLAGYRPAASRVAAA